MLSIVGSGLAPYIPRKLILIEKSIDFVANVLVITVHKNNKNLIRVGDL